MKQNFYMKLGRRKAGSWGPPRKGNKRAAHKGVRAWVKGRGKGE